MSASGGRWCMPSASAPADGGRPGSLPARRCGGPRPWRAVPDRSRCWTRPGRRRTAIAAVWWWMLGVSRAGAVGGRGAVAAGDAPAGAAPTATTAPAPPGRRWIVGGGIVLPVVAIVRCWSSARRPACTSCRCRRVVRRGRTGSHRCASTPSASNGGGNCTTPPAACGCATSCACRWAGRSTSTPAAPTSSIRSGCRAWAASSTPFRAAPTCCACRPTRPAPSRPVRRVLRAGHAHMVMTVIAMPAAFDAWLLQAHRP
jgi:hypothetical protein